MSEVSWQVTANEDAPCLTVRGELTRATVMQVWRARAQWLRSNTSLQIDLAEVVKVDSAGIAFLLETLTFLNQHQQELRLSNVGQQVRDIAAVSGVTDLLSLS